MNAVQLLRHMHADTKVRFKVILSTDDPSVAGEQWATLEPMLELHEHLEDTYVYTPVAEECGPGTPLGDWDLQHEADVAVVRDLVEAVNQADPGTPEWRMRIGRVMDALSRHVMDEEGQIFGRIEQLWGPDRLESAGAKMQREIAATTRGGTAKRAAVASARRRR
jgi:hypothetical protein